MLIDDNIKRRECVVKINDQRNDTEWVPAIDILQEYIPLVDNRFFNGISEIILLDEDYHANDLLDKANGRYVKMPREKNANIELYFDRFRDLPKVASESQIYISYLIIFTLLHELYHHRIIWQKIKRRNSAKQEEYMADKWAAEILDPIFTSRFPEIRYQDELDNIEKSVAEHRMKYVKELADKLNIDRVDLSPKEYASIQKKILKKLKRR